MAPTGAAVERVTKSHGAATPMARLRMRLTLRRYVVCMRDGRRGA